MPNPTGTTHCGYDPIISLNSIAYNFNKNKHIVKKFVLIKTPDIKEHNGIKKMY